MAINRNSATLFSGLSNDLSSNLVNDLIGNKVEMRKAGSSNQTGSALSQSLARQQQVNAQQQAQKAQPSISSNIPGMRIGNFTGSDIGADQGQPKKGLISSVRALNEGKGSGIAGAKATAKNARESVRGRTLSTIAKVFLGDWAGALAGAATGSKLAGAMAQGLVQGGGRGALSGGLNAAGMPQLANVARNGLGNYLSQNAMNQVSQNLPSALNNIKSPTLRKLLMERQGR